jgi:hypothetical protein
MIKGILDQCIVYSPSATTAAALCLSRIAGCSMKVALKSSCYYCASMSFIILLCLLILFKNF